MPLPLYDAPYLATSWATPTDFREHCDYLKARGFTGVHIAFADVFSPGTPLRQSGVNGVLPISDSSGTNFTLNATYANYVRGLVNQAAAAGLTVVLQSYGCQNWIGVTSDNGVLRVQNSFNAGKQLAQYFASAANITHVIHGWDTAINRSWENTIWANVRAGWESGTPVVSTKMLNATLDTPYTGAFMGSYAGKFNSMTVYQTPSNANAFFQTAQNAGFSVMLIPILSATFRNTAALPNSAVNLAAWNAGAVDQWVAAGVDLDYWVAQGVLKGAYLMDEPNRTNFWGSPALTGAQMDAMAAYYKASFPTVPCYFRVQPSWMPAYSYASVDGGWCQWEWVSGFSYFPKVYHDVAWYAADQQAATLARNMAVEDMVWSMAPQHGGQPNDGGVDIPVAGSWGLPIWSTTTVSGSSQAGYYMRPDEMAWVVDTLKDQPGIGFNMFKYDLEDWTSILDATRQPLFTSALNASITTLRGVYGL